MCPAENWPGEAVFVKRARTVSLVQHCWQDNASVLGSAMRRLLPLCVLVVSLGAAEIAKAQTREEMLRCRSISDEEQRLACYDAVELTGNPRRKYEILDLTELKSFALTYRGDLVEVIGWIRPSDDFLFLGVDKADAKPLPIDFEAIPRRDRDAFLRACGDGCEATVQGRVGPVNFTTGIVAETLIAR
jgi:hypothetical protein